MDVKFVRTIRYFERLEWQEILINGSLPAFRVIKRNALDTEGIYFNTRSTSGRYFELRMKSAMARLTDSEQCERDGFSKKSFSQMDEHLQRKSSHGNRHQLSRLQSA